MASPALAPTDGAPRPLTAAQYDKLVRALRRLLEEGRRRAELALGRELVRTYHAVGKRLLSHGLEQRAAYGAAVMRRIADDLEMDRRTLERATAFARTYPEGTPDLPLRWAHYRELIKLPSADQRAWYAEQCAAQSWSARKLREAVQEQQYRNREERTTPRLPAKRRKKLRRPTEATYVYRATVERVVDGDTLIALVDLGFDVLRRQRIRLAAIDTPPRDTPTGKCALQRVVDELATVSFVMVKTVKVDLYGRYVAHLFYEPGDKDKHRIFTQGRYLNQLLVDEGLATRL